jgi:XTP/dITP diphosphohydrolase
LDGVPKSLPSIVKAFRIQEKVHGVNFDWENSSQVLAKVKEEINELEEEIRENNHQKIEEEFGDVLFSLVNYARFLEINPEDALEKTNRKFIARFQKMEELIAGQGESLTEMNLAQMDEYWEKAKKVIGC